MDKAKLQKLLEDVQPMTADERAAQRESFAYGNARIENDRITRSVVAAAARKSTPGPTK